VPKVWAYVFVDTENPGPKRIVRAVRKLPGVVRADAESKVARWIG
jgi:hypothetical protein